MSKISKTELSPDNGCIIDTKWKCGKLSYHSCASETGDVHTVHDARLPEIVIYDHVGFKGDFGFAVGLGVGEGVALKAERARQSGSAKMKRRIFMELRRANQMVRDYPVHTLVAAGVVGVLLGVGIRVWRANRAY